LTKDEIVRSIRAERRSTFALLRTLEPPAYDTPTALPGWRIREVVAHLITTDRGSVLGLNLFAAMTSMDRVERWNDDQVRAWADRPVPDLLVALTRWGARFARFAKRLPSAVYRLRLPTMYGPGTGGLLLWARAFDEWVHRQDIRRALGLGDEEVDVDPTAGFVFQAVGTNMRRWSDVPKGLVDVDLVGAPMLPWRFDLSARTAAPRPPDATPAEATVSLPAAAFVMATAGRDRFEDLRRDGVLGVTGDPAVAEAFLARLRIV
jgi:uncharacterized protein (TIGR03083 family)